MTGHEGGPEERPEQGIAPNASARADLWRRFDAGELTAAEVETRLALLDAAGDDEPALRRALEGPLPLLRRATGGRRTAVAVALVALVVLGAAAVSVAKGDNGGSPTATSRPPDGGFVDVGPTVVFPAVDGAVTEPALPECDLPSPVGDATIQPANPSLLSDPPFLPEGYEVDDDDAITPGSDPDLSMSISAGEPLPVEIRGRVLDGDLAVRMRAFRYEDAAAAEASGAFAASSACSYAPDFHDVPDRPEIGVVTVRGVIPLTAFASWRLGDRRMTVAVEADGEGDGAEAEAVELAGQIAAAEYDAALAAPG